MTDTVNCQFEGLAYSQDIFSIESFAVALFQGTVDTSLRVIYY